MVCKCIHAYLNQGAISRLRFAQILPVKTEVLFPFVVSLDNFFL